MSQLLTTHTFTAGTLIQSAQVTTNFTDISTIWNAHDGGTDHWQNVIITATAANPMQVNGSAATTELSINNTATDGDPILSFELSGTAQFTIGVDDGDSDKFKIGTTAIGTSTSIEISGQAVTFPGTTTTTGNATFSALALLADGSAAAPSLAFSSDTNLGLYRSAADTINFSTGGADRGSISNSLVRFNDIQLQMDDRSVGAPAYSFSDDTDTGIYRAAANDLRISTGGVARFHVSNGAVTVGATVDIVPETDNTKSCGTASKRWSDLRSVLINGADYGFHNGWILREYPATYDDVQTQNTEWFEQNANKGIQVINDIGETVCVIGRDGTIYAKQYKNLADLPDIATIEPQEKQRKLNLKNAN